MVWSRPRTSPQPWRPVEPLSAVSAGFMACDFGVLVQFHCSRQPNFQLQQAAVFAAATATMHFLPSTRQLHVTAMRKMQCASTLPAVTIREV